MLTLTQEMRAAVRAANGRPVFVINPDTAEEFELRPRNDCSMTTLPAEGIEITADVCGGDARIAGTRIPVWGLVQARRLGISNDELLRCYPRLQPTDLVHAWAYADSHASEIERQIIENETA